MQKPHFKNLDSLRGLAALSVVFSHICLASGLLWVTNTPLRLFAAGHEAVILFFILSGFVLTLQLERTNIPYAQYALRRICRIYIPYLAVVAIGATIMVVTKPVDMSWAGAWWAGFWNAPLTANMIIGHVLLLAPFQTATIDGVIWSLIYEMRISFLMPLICFIVPRIGWKFSILGAFALTGISLFFQHKITMDVEAASLAGNWPVTCHYTAMFILGTVLAYHRQAIIAAVTRYRIATPLALASLALYAGAMPLAAFIHHEGFPGDWFIAIGACGLMVSTFTKSFFGTFTGYAIPRFLGKISFSLYLVHIIVFLTVFRLLDGRVAHVAMMPIAFVLTFPVAWLCYQWIERPSIELSRRVTQKHESAHEVVDKPVVAAAASTAASSVLLQDAG